jgi:hypothetical protein
MIVTVNINNSKFPHIPHAPTRVQTMRLRFNFTAWEQAPGEACRRQRTAEIHQAQGQAQPHQALQPAWPAHGCRSSSWTYPCRQPAKVIGNYLVGWGGNTFGGRTVTCLVQDMGSLTSTLRQGRHLSNGKQGGRLCAASTATCNGLLCNRGQPLPRHSGGGNGARTMSAPTGSLSSLQTRARTQASVSR